MRSTRDRETLKAMWRQFSPILGRFLMADALFKLLIFFTLSPLTAWFFDSVIRRSGSSAVSNTDIIGFLTSPIVLAGLFLSGAFSLAIAYAERTTLMQIAFGHQHGYTVSYRHILRQTAARLVNFVGLGALIMGRILLMLVPLAVVAGLLYFFNLREHDINYYLNARPRELCVSIAIATPVLLLTLVVLVRAWVTWSFALPAVFFENRPFQEALPYSSRLVQGQWWRVARLAYGVGLLLVVVVVLVIGLTAVLGGWLINIAANSTGLLLTVSGLLVLINWLLTLAAGFVASTYSEVVTTYLYTQAATDATFLYQPDHTEHQKLRITRRRAVALVLVGAIAFLGVGFVLLVQAYAVTERTITVTAHRGSSAAAPPNTLAAVQQAIDDGADYAEIDVQETADGVIILNHDKDYLLAAGVARDVHELTVAETQSLDVGSSFSPTLAGSTQSDFSGEGIPTLAQVLDLARGKIKVNIELKYYGQDVMLAERVVEIVRAKGMTDDVLIMSLHYAGVQEVRALAPEITVGFLASALTLGDLTGLDVDFLAVSSGLATANFVTGVHFADKQLFVWTLNDAEDVPTYLNRGVDSIITDYPVMVREQIDEWNKMSSSEKLLRSIAGRFTR